MNTNLYNILNFQSLMHDLDKTRQIKERIISTIRFKGPSLPVQLARALAIEPIFASAFLSELKAEEKLKVSDMKVGSSPVYYLPGQEDKLENYIQHLNQREREAFNLLKKEKILEDETQTPVTRVALRAIKDFAIPVRVRINEQVKTFWKYYMIPDAEISPMIESILYPERKQKQEQKIEKEIKESIAPQQEISHPKLEKPKEIIAQTPSTDIAQTKELEAPLKQQKLIEEKPKQIKEVIKEKSLEKEIKKPKIKEKKEKKPKEFAFPKNLKEYLQEKDIELLEILEEKNKEMTAKIRIDTLFGKQSFYLIAKDKKKISQDDLTIALQKAQAEKMPALFLSPGELDKKALPHLKDWNNLIKFEKIKL